MPCCASTLGNTCSNKLSLLFYAHNQEMIVESDDEEMKNENRYVYLQVLVVLYINLPSHPSTTHTHTCTERMTTSCIRKWSPSNKLARTLIHDFQTMTGKTEKTHSISLHESMTVIQHVTIHTLLLQRGESLLVTVQEKATKLPQENCLGHYKITL